MRTPDSPSGADLRRRLPVDKISRTGLMLLVECPSCEAPAGSPCDSVQAEGNFHLLRWWNAKDVSQKKGAPAALLEAVRFDVL